MIDFISEVYFTQNKNKTKQNRKASCNGKVYTSNKYFESKVFFSRYKRYTINTHTNP